MGAIAVARRLDGLPLALSTAGAYLRQTADSFDNYLKIYTNSWDKLGQYSNKLLDYDQERTLYSTWNISFTRVQAQDSAAAELLRLMAYFDNEDLWYELFQAGQGDQPEWWAEVARSKLRFNDAIMTLHEYSLVEIRKESFSLHACVHDWIMGRLNQSFDDQLWELAVRCIAQSVRWDTEVEYGMWNRRLLQHVRRVMLVQRSEIGLGKVEPSHFSNLAYLYHHLGQSTEAEQMYIRALHGYEKAWGPDHTLTLDTVSNLGRLYIDQSRLVDAEQMLTRALQGMERALGQEHTSTLSTVNNLGLLYTGQDKLDAAEKMYQRALQGREKALGPEHTATLDTVNNLGLLYANQGKLDAAEKMYQRALQGREKALGPEHTATLDTVTNLGALYVDQGKLDAAEKLYQRALQGYEKAWGSEHTSTLDTVNNLGLLYKNQSQLDLAEKMYQRALQGYEKALGRE